MKALAALAALLAIVAFLPSPAAAQQTGAVVVQLGAPESALVWGEGPQTFTGIVTLTADWTAVTSFSGIPVTYTVTQQPAWASVLVTPSSDVFPIPMGAPSTAFTVTRVITVTVGLGHEVDRSMLDAIEITATTTPGFLGASFTGRGLSPVSVYVPEPEDCPEHALTAEQLALYAQQADAALAEYEADHAADARDADEVTTQSAGGVSAMPVPWVAVAGFALVGAGVGLVLRRRFVR